jgi:ornithine cyclodeaminase/alanine dehydrogenase-like protein (mu-crystallin family)
LKQPVRNLGADGAQAHEPDPEAPLRIHLDILSAMALLLREGDVQSLIQMEAIIPAVDAAMRDLANGIAQNQPRRRVHPPNGSLSVMFASHPSAGFTGVKSYSVAGGKARFLVTLYDLEGNVAALIEADLMGAYRTGAATAVAARALLPAGPKQVAVIGTGWQAATQLHALRSGIKVAELQVYGRDAERRASFAAEAAEWLDLPATAAGSVEQAVAGADLVVTMTTSATPVLEAEWIKPGALVVGAGSNFANRAELPPDLVERAGLVVVDQLETARLESGDLLQAIQAGSFEWSRAVELGAVMIGAAETRPGETTIFESHGLALWDVAAGAVVLQRALRHRVGEEVRL